MAFNMPFIKQHFSSEAQSLRRPGHKSRPTTAADLRFCSSPWKRRMLKAGGARKQDSNYHKSTVERLYDDYQMEVCFNLSCWNSSLVLSLRSSKKNNNDPWNNWAPEAFLSLILRTFCCSIQLQCLFGVLSCNAHLQCSVAVLGLLVCVLGRIHVEAKVKISPNDSPPSPDCRCEKACCNVWVISMLWIITLASLYFDTLYYSLMWLWQRLLYFGLSLLFYVRYFQTEIGVGVWMNVTKLSAKLRACSGCIEANYIWFTVICTCDCAQILQA
jgi:hypothetical protein